ncbi:hypothetical protein LCGC14_0303240 [marine sediment metagenome]|uniref:N-acetyltransferase domain-containing protein n=1 Tax=marine sediment metagenome TaxID=412755 RepID=A0A0F9WVT6_9ZZZZ
MIKENHFLYSVARPDDLDWWLGADAESIQLLRAIESGANMYSYWSEFSNHQYQLTDQFAGIPVSSYADWWNSISRKTRNMVRKAQKLGLTVQRMAFNDELLAATYAIYNESPTRQNRAFPPYGRNTKRIAMDREKTLPQYYHGEEYLVARHNGKIIAYIHLVYTRDSVMFNEILGLMKHRNTSAINFLINEAVKLASDMKLKYIIYGKLANNNLGKFKLNNGFEKIKMYRYFAPVNIRGKLICSLRIYKWWYYGGRLKDKILRISKSFIRKHLSKIKRKIFKPKTYPVHLLDDCETVASFFTTALQGNNDLRYFYNYEKKRKFKEIILVDNDRAGTRALTKLYSADWEYRVADAFEQVENIYLDKKRYDLVNCDIWISMIPDFFKTHLPLFVKITNKYLVVTMGRHSFESFAGLPLTLINLENFINNAHKLSISVVDLKDRKSSWDGGVYWAIIQVN